MGEYKFMSTNIKIGIIGDYDGRPSHIATEEALRHCSDRLGISLETIWLPTYSFEEAIPKEMSDYDGFWCAPGSPYKSMKGALNAIRFVRENDDPFIGTCGGFQHGVIEFGRNVLQINELKDESFDPYLPNKFITPLACSLVGQTRNIKIEENTVISHIYGSSMIEERYNCSFGLDKNFQSQLDINGFRIAGTDENGEARIMVFEKNSFYVVSLFQPQLSSSMDNPHPLIMAYLSACYNFNEREKKSN